MAPWKFTQSTGQHPKIHVLVFGSHRQHTNGFTRSIHSGGKGKKKSIGNTHEINIGDHKILLVEPAKADESEGLSPSDLSRMWLDICKYSRKKRPQGQGKRTNIMSAIYVYAPTNQDISLASQQNIRMLSKLNSTGVLCHFFILPISSKASSSISSTQLLDSPIFQNSMDSSLWRDYLPPANCNRFEDLVQILSKPPSARKTEPLDDRDAVETLRSLERSFLNDVQRYMFEREARVREEVQKSIPEPIPEPSPVPPEAPRLEQSVQTVEVEPLTPVQPSNQQSVAQYTSRIRILESEISEAEQAINALKRAMDEDSKVHNSLLASLNIHDNHDVSSIKRGFEVLNDRISDFASEIVEQLMDHAESSLDDVNALNCHDSSGLFQLLGATQNSPSLLRSRSGKALSAGLFIDFAVGSIVCRAIHEEIFSPFYPLLQSGRGTEMDDKSRLLSDIYQIIRKRDPQMQSAKWRADTYSTLVKLDPEDQGLRQRIQNEVGASINAIITCLIGKAVPLDDELKRLGDIIQKALGLNNMVKTEVLRVGDFQTMFFAAGELYDKEKMSILDEKVDKDPPLEILSTYGLGLLLTQAVGGNQEPKTEVIMKAKVVSEASF